MEESFRRAIRKMTGASIRLNACPNRSSMVADLSQSMMVTWSIALFEHLDALLNNLDPSVGSSEQISYSETAWKLATLLYGRGPAPFARGRRLLGP